MTGTGTTEEGHMLRSALRRFRSPGGQHVDQEAGAALLTVVLLMFIVLALATLVLGAVVSQVKPTVATQQSTRVVFAAETGMQTALAQIRTSTSGDGTGRLRALPCRMTGTVPGPGGTLSFTAVVSYFVQDPAGKDASWQTANAIPCTPGTGVTTQPAYALIHTVGEDAGSTALVRSRSLLAQYAFKVSNQNVPGGVLWTAPRDACLQASSTSAGSTVSYQPAASCTSSDDRQRWVYDTGYHLVLAATVATTTSTSGGRTTSTTSGLCITQPDLGAAVRTTTLEACTLDSRNPLQLWSYEGGAHFRGQKADNSDYGGNCLYAGQRSWSTGALLKAGGSDTCGASNQAWGSFSPDAQVGAGAASLATSQLVNYKEFGRCADATNQRTDSSYMILYPCKQDPSGGGQLNWNHRWYYGAESGTVSEPAGAAGMATRIRVREGNDPNRTTCLTAPPGGATPAFVVLRGCDQSSSQQFTRYYATGSYSSSYTLVAADGRCLSVGPERSPSNDGVKWSTMVLAACNGGPEQKWNAPPTALQPNVTRQLETSVAG